MKTRILVADDHAVVRDGLRLILQATGDLTVVGEAANGREAVSEARRLGCDVVVMDLSMPEMNGIEATAEIVQLAGQPRVVILSVHATSEHISRALRAGATCYVLKESAGSQVVEAVRCAARGQRYVSPRAVETLLDAIASPSLDVLGKSPVESLSARERQVIQLVAEGRSSTAIGAALTLSPKTVETYRARILKKLGLENNTQLIKFAVQHALTGPE